MTHPIPNRPNSPPSPEDHVIQHAPRKPDQTASQSDDLSAAFDEAARCLQLIAHPERLQLLERLAQSPATACDLANAYDWSLAQTQQNLTLLHQCGFLDRLPDRHPTAYRVHQPILKDWLGALQQQSFQCTSSCSLPDTPFF